MIQKVIFSLFLIFIVDNNSYSTEVKIEGNEILLKGDKNLYQFSYNASDMGIKIKGKKGTLNLFEKQDKKDILNISLDPKNKRRVLYSYNKDPIDQATARVEESKRHSRIHLMYQSIEKKKFNLNFKLSDEMTNQLEALIIPDGDGLIINPADPLWVKHYANHCYSLQENLTLPLIVLKTSEGQIGVWTETPYRAKICFRETREGKLSFDLIHQNSEKDYDKIFELTLTTTVPKTIFNWRTPTLVDIGLFYRDYLNDSHQLVTMLFKHKKKFRPNIEKLMGGSHIYLWGNGHSKNFINKLHENNINKAVLIYQPEEGKKEIIDLAKSYHYLIGPYDSFMNVQDPTSSESFSSTWDDKLFREGPIIKKDGEQMIGFGGRGFYLSSEGLMKAEKERGVLKQRVKKHQDLSINQFFLDCDAYGDFKDDYSKIHPMNLITDRANRIKRMSLLSLNNKWVLGSENAKPYSFGVVDYSHGTHQGASDSFFKLMKDKKRFGGWKEDEGKPEILFKEVQLSDEEFKKLYHPRYRIPLFQSVIHDGIVSLDRWEASYLKFPQITRTRELIDLLYLSPTIWNLDDKIFNENKNFITKHEQFFSPLLEEAGEAMLIHYKRKNEGLYQKALYETSRGKVEVNANFHQKEYKGIPPMCGRVKSSSGIKIYCPHFFAKNNWSELLPN